MFERLTGNRRAKDTLRRMLAGGRVPGALLFTGEEGVGKRLFALETAKALNCHRARSGGPAEACDRCPACARLARFAKAFGDGAAEGGGIIWSEHPDVGLVRPAGRFIVIGQAREVEREANFRPYEGAARILIIDEADRLKHEAANSLLKTLEEAPPTAHLFLITSRPASILPTIRSRCQMVRFMPLTAQEIVEHLSRQPGKKLSPPDMQLVAQLAHGSLGRALAIDPASYRAQRDVMLEVLEALTVRPDKTRLLRAAEELSDAKRKDEYEPRLEALTTLIHDVWRLSLAGGAAELVNEDARERLARITARAPGSRAARWLQRVENLRGQLTVNINRRVATDALFLAMEQD